MPTRVRRWVVAVVAAAGCGASSHPDITMSSCRGLFAASDDGAAWAYVDGDHLTVVAGGARTQLRSSLDCSFAGADALMVGPGGATVALYGTRSNIDGDLWGHSGRSVTAACVIDVATAAVRPLSKALGSHAGQVGLRAAGRRIVMWRRTRPDDGVIVVDGDGAAPLVVGGRTCEVAVPSADVGEVACDDGDAITVHRFRLDTLAAVGDDVRVPRRAVGGDGDLAITPDGRTVVYWGREWPPGASTDAPMRSRVVAIDVARGKDALVYDRADGGGVYAAAPDPGGSGDVVIAESATGDSSRGIVRRVNASGRIVAERTLEYLMTPQWAGRTLWAIGSCDARRLAP